MTISDSETTTRRSVVTATGTLALGGLAALAGCSGSTDGGSGGGASDGGSGGASDGGSGGGDSDGGSSDGDSDGGSGGGDSDGGSSDGDDGSDGGTGSFGGWMEAVGNYDGVADETGSDRVTVSVGADGNGGAFAFAPPAVRVSAGTTVVWEWTGGGGQHNVAAAGGGFESDLSSEEGHTFEHTFSEAGTVKYVCTPHESLGMKGVVVVE